jgi:DNA-binding MarR family transcriptional regulator
MRKPENPADLYAVLNEMQIISQLWSNEVRGVLPENLTLAQFSVLNWFSRVDDQATPGRLARAFQVTKGAMTHTLGWLSDAGLVTVEPDPASGRRKIVRRTARGAQLRETSIRRTRRLLDAIGAEVGAERLMRLQPTLVALRQNLDLRRGERRDA